MSSRGLENRRAENYPTFITRDPWLEVVRTHQPNWRTILVRGGTQVIHHRNVGNCMVIRPAPTSNDPGGGVLPLFPGCFVGLRRTLVVTREKVPSRTLIYSGNGCTASRIAPEELRVVGEHRKKPS